MYLLPLSVRGRGPNISIAILSQGAPTRYLHIGALIVSIFGVPLQIHSDQGSNFESKVFKEMCIILGIHKTRTTPSRPQSDGMIEKFGIIPR
jgi:transposase InsO family protein